MTSMFYDCTCVIVYMYMSVRVHARAHTHTHTHTHTLHKQQTAMSSLVWVDAIPNPLFSLSHNTHTHVYIC